MSEKTLTSFPAEGLDYGKTYAREKWGGRSSISYDKDQQKFESHSTVTGKSFPYNPTDEDLSAQDWYEVVEQNEAAQVEHVEQPVESVQENFAPESVQEDPQTPFAPEDVVTDNQQEVEDEIGTV